MRNFKAPAAGDFSSVRSALISLTRLRRFG
jgi:hypothetical protein